MDSEIDERETKALIQILELGDTAFDSGKGIPASEVFAELLRKKGIES